LSLHDIFGCPIEGLDPEMLLDPFEEELHLPTAPIEIGDGDRREGKVVGQKHQCFVLFGIEAADTAQFFWVVSLRIMPFEDNNLVALNPCSSVHRPRIEAPSAEIGFGPSNEEGAGLMNSVKAAEIEVTAIHDIDGPDSDDQVVEDIDIVDVSGGCDHHRRNAAMQVRQGMHLYCVFPFRNLAQGNRDKQRLMVVESRA